MFLNLRRADRDIGEMIADPLKLPQQFNKDHTALDRTFSLVPAGDMLHLVLAGQLVDFTFSIATLDISGSPPVYAISLSVSFIID